MNSNELRQLCIAAGLTEDELRDEPELGLLVSASGVQKLAALAPDREAARDLLDLIAREVRKTFRVVPGART
jgi:hypothetical protein